MLSERALRPIAGAAGLGVGQCAHEYVMLCALDALSRTPLLANTFCLKGGTALRLAYFGDWRHSVDLDFGVLPALRAESLQAGLAVHIPKRRMQKQI
jgi:predicted nucleotidyltransferase component of viral defense system